MINFATVLVFGIFLSRVVVSPSQNDVKKRDNALSLHIDQGHSILRILMPKGSNNARLSQLKNMAMGESFPGLNGGKGGIPGASEIMESSDREIMDANGDPHGLNKYPLGKGSSKFDLEEETRKLVYEMDPTKSLDSMLHQPGKLPEGSGMASWVSPGAKTGLGAESEVPPTFENPSVAEPDEFSQPADLSEPVDLSRPVDVFEPGDLSKQSGLSNSVTSGTPEGKPKLVPEVQDLKDIGYSNDHGGNVAAPVQQILDYSDLADMKNAEDEKKMEDLKDAEEPPVLSKRNMLRMVQRGEFGHQELKSPMKVQLLEFPEKKVKKFAPVKSNSLQNKLMSGKVKGILWLPAESKVLRNFLKQKRLADNTKLPNAKLLLQKNFSGKEAGVLKRNAVDEQERLQGKGLTVRHLKREDKEGNFLTDLRKELEDRLGKKDVSIVKVNNRNLESTTLAEELTSMTIKNNSKFGMTVIIEGKTQNFFFPEKPLDVQMAANGRKEENTLEELVSEYKAKHGNHSSHEGHQAVILQNTKRNVAGQPNRGIGHFLTKDNEKDKPMSENWKRDALAKNRRWRKATGEIQSHVGTGAAHDGVVFKEKARQASNVKSRKRRLGKLQRKELMVHGIDEKVKNVERESLQRRETANDKLQDVRFKSGNSNGKHTNKLPRLA